MQASQVKPSDNFPLETVELMLPIAAVERDTGISKDTLRMWERRYGFPKPNRDGYGERRYDSATLEKLRLLKRLLDAGARPGKTIGLPLGVLHDMAQNVSPSPVAVRGARTALIEQSLSLITQHQMDAFRRLLVEQITQLGLGVVVRELIAPMTYEVGEAWRAGRLAIFEEHLFTEALHSVLRGAMANVSKTRQSPKVLLTTFPQEPHGLGLLMAQTLFALEDCAVQSLGVQTPVWDIVQAARLQHMEVVALSFSLQMNRQAVIEGLRELRMQLPASIEIWAGGSNPALSRRMGEGLIAIQSLDDIALEVARWRTLHKKV